VNALQLWFGGWLLFNYPGTFSFNDFTISMFALLFSLFGLGAAFQGVSDRKETEASAGRIFYLLDRKSEIDPLGEDGLKLDDDTVNKDVGDYKYPYDLFRKPEDEMEQEA
jgi:ATP-binding cassette subfamily B (MDR/TAP) protein 1